MTTDEIFPIGTTVRVHSDLGGRRECQVIDIRLDKKRGELLYALGHITPRRGLLRKWPKITNLHHWASQNHLEAIEARPHTNGDY